MFHTRTHALSNHQGASCVRCADAPRGTRGYRAVRSALQGKCGQCDRPERQVQQSPRGRWVVNLLLRECFLGGGWWWAFKQEVGEAKAWMGLREAEKKRASGERKPLRSMNFKVLRKGIG